MDRLSDAALKNEDKIFKANVTSLHDQMIGANNEARNKGAPMHLLLSRGGDFQESIDN
jgi:hypothetical protein